MLMATHKCNIDHNCLLIYTDGELNDSYISMVLPSLKVSHHVQMTKEEQQRLLQCKPVSQECVWQTKASLMSEEGQSMSVGIWMWLTDQKESAVNIACHLQQWLSDLHVTVLSCARVYLDQLKL